MKTNVALLIPTYQPGNYLIDCLQSVSNQNYPTELFRVYIALNGSSEYYHNYLKEIIKSLPYDVTLYFLPQPGVSNARNFLIDNSKEEFIVFIDDDDVISPNFLSELVKVSSQTTMGISNVANFKENPHEYLSNYIGSSFDKLQKIEPSKTKSRKYFSSPWAKMLHRSMIDQYRFDASLARGEDSLFMATISKNILHTQKTLDNAYYHVRERLGSVTRRKINKKEEISRILYLLKEYFKLFLCKGYNKIFIFTRILATLKHLKNLLQ